jgi:hypothetical protein
MAVVYHRFNGKRVSREWYVVLTAAVHEGAIAEHDLDSGHRTMDEQTVLVREKGVWSPANPHGAALPNRTAPHIRLGRPDHALDVNALNGAARRLASFLARKGAHPHFTVPPEPWHIELDLDELRELAHTLGVDPFAGYTAAEKRWITEYDRLVRQRRDRGRRRVLRRAMTRQRKAIWRAAQHSGWTRSNRRKRYASLRARTT